MISNIFKVIMPCLFLVLSGCGYHFGSMMHPQLKSIAIGNVTNDTTSYNAGTQVKSALAEQFMVDGSLKLTSLAKADCIIYAKVAKIGFAEVTHISYQNDDNVFLPREWQAMVTIDYSLVVPGRANPVMKGKATGTSNFQVQADVNTNQLQGVRQAAREAAIKIVKQVTEGW